MFENLGELLELRTVPIATGYTAGINDLTPERILHCQV